MKEPLQLICNILTFFFSKLEKHIYFKYTFFYLQFNPRSLTFNAIKNNDFLLPFFSNSQTFIILVITTTKNDL